MSNILDLPVWSSLLILVLFTVITGVIIIVITHKLIKGRLTKQHERVGRLLFRVTASLLALLVSLSYANEKVNYDKVANSLEEEAALIAGVMLKLKVHRTPMAEDIREGLIEYVEFTIADGFEAVVNNPYYSKMWGTMIRLNIIARELGDETDKQARLKATIIEDIDQITRTLQIRFYSTKFHLPYLTYILCFGLLISWMFYGVYDLNRVSIIFISLYNTLLAVLMYFVIMLGSPMMGPLKVEPSSFMILKEMGLDRLPF